MQGNTNKREDIPAATTHGNAFKEGRQYFLYKEEHDAKVIADLKKIDPCSQG